MSAGCALVVAEGSGSEELVKDCGIVVPVQNSQELEKILRELLYNEEQIKTFGLQSRVKVQSDYDIQVVGDKYWQVYKKYLDVE